MDKVIITAAICGAEVTREDTPYLPVTAKELAEESKRCLDAGAAVIHLHVRKDDGTPTQDKKYFRQSFNAISRLCPELPIIQPSTGGAAGMTIEERIHPLELLPEMATLDCGTVNFGDEIFINTLPMMRTFGEKMKSCLILPELECFEIGHIHNALILANEGILTGHLHFNFILGLRGAINASPESLLSMLREIPDNATWTATGIGRHEIPMALMAIAMGGHIRVGLEDNIYYKKNILLKGSAPMVERIARIARESGREPATPDEARDILHIGRERKIRSF